MDKILADLDAHLIVVAAWLAIGVSVVTLVWVVVSALISWRRSHRDLHGTTVAQH